MGLLPDVPLYILSGGRGLRFGSDEARAGLGGRLLGTGIAERPRVREGLALGRGGMWRLPDAVEGAGVALPEGVDRIPTAETRGRLAGAAS